MVLKSAQVSVRKFDANNKEFFVVWTVAICKHPTKENKFCIRAIDQDGTMGMPWNTGSKRYVQKVFKNRYEKA